MKIFYQCRKTYFIGHPQNYLRPENLPPEWKFSLFVDISDMASNDKKVDMDNLLENDEFEEFASEDWDIRQEDQTDIQVWEDTWDDDDTDSDFAKHLKEKLEEMKESEQK